MSQPLLTSTPTSARDYSTFDTTSINGIGSSSGSSGVIKSSSTTSLLRQHVNQPTQEQGTSIANTSTFHQTSIINPNDLLKSRGVMFLCIGLFTSYCLIGITFYTQVEGWTILDSLYFCVVTITTVGFGDLIPHDPTAKLFTAIFELLGIGVAGSALGILGNQMLEAQQSRFVESLHKSPPTGNQSPMEGDPEANKSVRSSRAKMKPLASVVVLIFLLAMGAFGFSYIEGFTLLDSFYMCCSTITTVGYGDFAPHTRTGRAFAIVWILTGTFVLAKTFSDVLNYFIESRQRALARQIMQHTLTHEDSIATLDADSDGRISEAEYVAAMVVKLGYVSQDKVDWLRQSFQRVDANGDGVLTWDELKDAIHHTSHHGTAAARPPSASPRSAGSLP